MTHSRRSEHFNRRLFLRGLGASVVLPTFGSLGASRAAAAVGAKAGLAATAAGTPIRSAFLYIPNGVIQKAWWPTENEAGYQFNKTLEPLESLKDKIQILGGLDHKTAEGGPDGAGDHARGNGTFLTGVRLNKSASNVRAGTSIDQAIARKIGHLTRFPSLELSCETSRKSGACDSGYACAYQFNLSWSSPTTPVPAESNPRLVFERLFGSGGPGERLDNLKRRRQEHRSILDFAMEDARAMKRRLGSQDQEKLGQYLDGVREIETRIETAEKLGDAQDPGIATPSGAPADYEEHVQLMFDMLVLAFQTDSTRVATMALAYDGNNRSFDQIGITEGHHDLSHHQNRPDWMQKVADIDMFYVKQLAKFLGKLESTKEVDGTSLLYNSMIVYGSGNSDGNRHTHSNLPIVLAGSGGGALTPGRYVKHGAQPLTNLFLSMSDRLGVSEIDRFGDSEGRLANV